jgi:hypothetical protein
MPTITVLYVTHLMDGFCGIITFPVHFPPLQRFVFAIYLPVRIVVHAWNVASLASYFDLGWLARISHDLFCYLRLSKMAISYSPVSPQIPLNCDCNAGIRYLLHPLAGPPHLDDPSQFWLKLRIGCINIHAHARSPPLRTL